MYTSVLVHEFIVIIHLYEVADYKNSFNKRNIRFRPLAKYSSWINVFSIILVYYEGKILHYIICQNLLKYLNQNGRKSRNKQQQQKILGIE